MGKKQRDDANTNEVGEPWWENISYEGFLKLANTTFKPALFLKLTGNEFKLLAYLTFLRWRFAERSGQLRLGHDYLVNGTGLSQGTVRRCMKSLGQKHFLRLLKIDRNNGNTYLIYTILLLPPCDQIDRSANSSDQIDRTVRSKRSHATPPSRTTCDQIDQEDHIQTYQRDGAPRHAPPTTSAGGVAAAPSEAEKRCPNGQDQKIGRGVALPGDVINVAQLPAAEIANYCAGVREERTARGWAVDALEAEIKRVRDSQEHKEKTVGSGARSNFHAQIKL
jgi:hypothetical protein